MESIPQKSLIRQSQIQMPRPACIAFSNLEIQNYVELYCYNISKSSSLSIIVVILVFITSSIVRYDFIVPKHLCRDWFECSLCQNTASTHHTCQQPRKRHRTQLLQRMMSSTNKSGSQLPSHNAAENGGGSGPRPLPRNAASDRDRSLDRDRSASRQLA